MSDLIFDGDGAKPVDHVPWAWLTGGEIAEVCVVSYRGLGRDLPQTLGLEVIQYEAYMYDGQGIARTPEQRAELAQQLAAHDRWLAIGGPRYWVDAFARRAGAILVMPGPHGQAANTTVDAFLMHLSWMGAAFYQRLFPKRAARTAKRMTVTDMARSAWVGYSGDTRLTDTQLAWYYRDMRGYVLEAFPEKTFVLTSDDLKQLRSVRARRRE